MDIETFEDAMDRHGPDLDRWPDVRAAEARSLVESSARARDLLAQARELDLALRDLLSSAPAPLGLKTRILANLPEREVWLEWFGVKAWRPVGLALVPLLVGFSVGVNVAAVGSDVAEYDEDTESDVLLALFDPDELARFGLPGTDDEP